MPVKTNSMPWMNMRMTQATGNNTSDQDTALNSHTLQYASNLTIKLLQFATAHTSEYKQGSQPLTVYTCTLCTGS